MTEIDIHFDVYSDTPKGKDPDTNSPLPSNTEEYLIYKENVEDFIKKRNDRIISEC